MIFTFPILTISRSGILRIMDAQLHLRENMDGSTGQAICLPAQHEEYYIVKLPEIGYVYDNEQKIEIPEVIQDGSVQEEYINLFGQILNKQEQWTLFDELKTVITALPLEDYFYRKAHTEFWIKGAHWDYVAPPQVFGIVTEPDADNPSVPFVMNLETGEVGVQDFALTVDYGDLPAHEWGFADAMEISSVDSDTGEIEIFADAPGGTVLTLNAYYAGTENVIVSREIQIVRAEPDNGPVITYELDSSGYVLDVEAGQSNVMMGNIVIYEDGFETDGEIPEGTTFEVGNLDGGNITPVAGVYIQQSPETSTEFAIGCDDTVDSSVYTIRVTIGTTVLEADFEINRIPPA